MINFGAGSDAEGPHRREYFPKHQPECERLPATYSRKWCFYV